MALKGAEGAGFEEFEGAGRIERELKGAANQLRERDAVHVVRVRNAREENEKGEVAYLVDGFKDRVPWIKAGFEYAQGPVPEDAVRYDFSTNFPEESELDGERFLSEGEIGLIAERLEVAIEASRDKLSPEESRVVKLRAGDRLKYVTPDRYVVPAGMRGIWPASIDWPILLDDLLEMAVDAVRGGVKIDGDYVELLRGDGDLSPVDQLKRYLNESGDFRLAKGLRDALFFEKGSLTSVGYFDFPRGVTRAQRGAGRSVKYLEGVSTADDVIVVFYEGRVGESRITKVSCVPAHSIGQYSGIVRDYGLEVFVDPTVGTRVALGTFERGAKSTGYSIDSRDFRRSEKVSEIRFFKLVGADGAAKT